MKLPSYNNFWVFAKVRSCEDKIDGISEVTISELKRELHLSAELGKNTAHDGFVIRAHDKGAVCDGHYETTMYKTK